MKSFPLFSLFFVDNGGLLEVIMKDDEGSTRVRLTKEQIDDIYKIMDIIKETR